MKRRRIPLFWSTVITLVFFFILVKVGIPYISMWIIKSDAGSYPGRHYAHLHGSAFDRNFPLYHYS
jgi:hypothetical protein